MRRTALMLAVLALVGLAASTALAGPSSPSVSVQVGPTLVGHHGHPGYSPGYRSHRPGYHRPPHYRSPYRGRPPVIIYPMVPGHPPVMVPIPGHPPVVLPPPHHRYRRPYGPHGSIHYRGSGFGISIGF